MRTDWFTKACLMVIAVALTAIALQSPASRVYAALPGEYKVQVAGNDAHQFQKQLDRARTEGWELVTTCPGQGNLAYLIYRK